MGTACIQVHLAMRGHPMATVMVDKILWIEDAADAYSRDAQTSIHLVGKERLDITDWRTDVDAMIAKASAPDEPEAAAGV